jgi:hypothetical protein
MHASSVHMRNKLLLLLIWTSAPAIAAFGQSSKQVYKAPPNGKVTFSLEEQWWEEKNVAPKGDYLGDAQLTIQYSDGDRQTIVFLGSSEYLESKIEFSGNHGFSTWTQTANLRPNATFAIISSQRAEAENAYEPVGGNHFGGGYITGSVARVSSDAPPYNSPPETSTPPVGPASPGPVPASANIHAIIISGRSDPAKIVTSSNVTLTGGIVALGKDSSPPARPTTQWSAGLRIVPDEALLTGIKIPPITPNIIDVRIVSHEVTGDLSTPVP